MSSLEDVWEERRDSVPLSSRKWAVCLLRARLQCYKVNEIRCLPLKVLLCDLGANYLTSVGLGLLCHKMERINVFQISKCILLYIKHSDRHCGG